MNILVTGVGGPTPRSFAIALKMHPQFAQTNLIATDINPLAIGLYQRHLFSKGIVVPRAGSDSYWPAIEAIIEQENITHAVVLPELEVMEWARRYATAPLNCNVLLPAPAIAELLVNKAAMTELLQPHGLVPASVAFNRQQTDLAGVFAHLGPAFWVRSSSGTSGLGSLLIDSEQSLRNWMQINPGVTEFLASTYLPGRNLACKLLYYNGALMRAACGERVHYIMAKVAPSGITGNTSFGRLLNEPQLVARAEQAMEILFNESGAARHGFFTVDFKEDAAGTPFITEVNVRHVAFTQCFAAAGANFAADTLRLLNNDASFERETQVYSFTPGQIFLRDVDALPIMMLEQDLLKA